MSAYDPPILKARETVATGFELVRSGLEHLQRGVGEMLAGVEEIERGIRELRVGEAEKAGALHAQASLIGHQAKAHGVAIDLLLADLAQRVVALESERSD